MIISEEQFRQLLSGLASKLFIYKLKLVKNKKKAVTKQIHIRRTFNN